MKHITLDFNWPKYAIGPFAPGRIQLKICPNCGRRIDFNADRCEGCNADRANGWKPLKLNKDCDLQTVFTSSGGYFKKGESVHVFAKNGCIAFKAESGDRFVRLNNDFFLCSRRETSFGKTVSLVFSDFTINMRDNDVAEKIMVYIYSSVVNNVLEKENCFYNTNNELFPI